MAFKEIYRFHGEKNTEIEHVIVGSVTRLYVYEQKNSEASFFSDWEDSNTGFGLIKRAKFRQKKKLSEVNFFFCTNFTVLYKVMSIKKNNTKKLKNPNT